MSGWPVSESSEHALALIDKIVNEAACPVILLIQAPIPLRQGGLEARNLRYVTDVEVGEWQSAIDIVLRRFAEYHDLEGAQATRLLQ